ncbi:MAG: Smr/MutS family protein, partial [Saprospiraceae bacterium]|nr:Smr/MutS family protein [Saprospiraceae bacterium]
FRTDEIGGLSGQVEHVHKGKATIRTGNMTLEAPLKDLEMSQEPIELSPNKSIQTDLYGAAKTYRKLDIRGLRKAEALLRIEQFIDQALVTNLGTVEIIHGKGNGVLKSVLKEKLREYDHSFVIHHPAPEHGGEGVSIINLNG